MNQLNELLTKFDNLEIDLLYNKATSLLELITDEEYEQLCEKYSALLSPISNPKTGKQYIRSKSVLLKIINIFINCIKSRKLTKDEYNNMTLKEIKEYINNKLDEAFFKEDKLYEVIKILDN